MSERRLLFKVMIGPGDEKDPDKAFEDAGKENLPKDPEATHHFRAIHKRANLV